MTRCDQFDGDMSIPTRALVTYMVCDIRGENHGLSDIRMKYLLVASNKHGTTTDAAHTVIDIWYYIIQVANRRRTTWLL